MNLLTVVVFIVATLMIYSLLESYTKLMKKYKQLLKECNKKNDNSMSDYSTTIYGKEYILPDSIYDIKKTVLSSLKDMLNKA
jgi:hypothetical protein